MSENAFGRTARWESAVFANATDSVTEDEQVWAQLEKAGHVRLGTCCLCTIKIPTSVAMDSEGKKYCKGHYLTS